MIHDITEVGNHISKNQSLVTIFSNSKNASTYTKDTKLKKEQHILYKVAQHFEGMQKLEVFDLLQKMEELLLHVSSPITKNSIRKIINSDTNVSRIVALPNGNLCECIGANDWLYVYKEQRKGISRFKIFDTYYFKINSPFSEIKKLTNENLLESYRDTAEEVDILDFLRKNKTKRKEEFVKRLLLLGL